MVIKQFMVLVRGSAREAAESITDKHAVMILRQQIRDCANEIETARKAVAVSIALNKQEALQHEKLLRQIEEIETRAVSALEQGKHDLAREAANTIALLEAERDSYLETQQTFNAEIERLKLVIRKAEQRLQKLKSGERLASAADKTQHLRNVGPEIGMTSLKEAEDTLERLRLRQKRVELTAEALEDMVDDTSPERINEKLIRAGCGKPPFPNADSVLARLATRVEAKTALNSNN